MTRLSKVIVANKPGNLAVSISSRLGSRTRLTASLDSGELVHCEHLLTGFADQVVNARILLPKHSARWRLRRKVNAREGSQCVNSRDKIASTREESKLFASTSAQPRPLVLVRGPCRTPRWPQRERQRRQWTVREPVRGCGCL